MAQFSMLLLILILTVGLYISTNSAVVEDKADRRILQSEAFIPMSNSSRYRQQTVENTLLRFDLSTLSNLTITSVLYNPTNHVSDWVDGMFGSKGVFYSKANVNDFFMRGPLTEIELKDRSEHFQKRFSLPNYALRPSCSIELLGYVLSEENGAFDKRMRQELYIGSATVNIKKRSLLWQCFYRVVFENWRQDSIYSSPNFWAVLFYCPAPTEEACSAMDISLQKTNEKNNERNNERNNEKNNENNRKLDEQNEFGIVEMQTPNKSLIWQTTFTSRLFSNRDRKTGLDGTINSQSISRSISQISTQSQFDTISNISVNNVMGTRLKKMKSAVCLSVPYTSTDNVKAGGNGAMLLEWIRYYALLGFKVLVYDRDGANKHHVYGSKYGESQKIRIPPGRLVYHPYTIRGLLDPSRDGLKYDNTEGHIANNLEEENKRRSRYESQGHDKVQTLTHCRFEAKALFGIENVLVVDFDEFLYCPVAQPTLRAQASWINQYFLRSKSQGVDQIQFTQRVVGNKTESPRDCVVKNSEEGNSIFDCFGSYLYYNGAHSVKSMHLGHSCPLTGYHTACPSDEIPRSHNCLCKTILMKSNNWRPYETRKGRECAVIHLSTNGFNYGREEYVFTDEEQQAVIESTLELWTVVNVKSTANYYNKNKLKRKMQNAEI